MDADKLRRRVAYIETLDRDQFVAELAAIMARADDPQARAESVGGILLDLIRLAPDLLEMMAEWAAIQEDRERLERLIDMADSYFRLQEDELDDQRHKLLGLLDDAYLVGKLAEHFAASGMVYSGLEQIAVRTRLAALMLGGEIVSRLHTRIVEAGGAIEERPTLQVDRRLLGVWYHKTFYESGDFSHMSVTSRLFGADGRYVEGDQSFVGMVFRESSGEESGRTDTSRASPSSRGSWALRDNILTLKADTGAEHEYKAEVYADSILLSQPGRDAELWTRR